MPKMTDSPQDLERETLVSFLVELLVPATYIQFLGKFAEQAPRS
jgi:hypothetical protein